jgi:hypothetical protein
MKTFTAAIFLIALVSAQAGIVDYVLNRTSIQGKASFNTTNGLNLDYNGSLTYNVNGYNIPIVGLGVHFDATPQNVSMTRDSQNASVKYNGGISIIDRGVSTNLTINGLTAVANTVSSKYDNRSGATNITFAQTINDDNSFALRTGAAIVTGKTVTGLSAAGVVQQRGSHVRLSENVTLDTSTRGSVSNNGTSLGAFTASRNVQAHVNEGVRVHANATGKRPNADFKGQARFSDAGFLAFQGTTYNVSKEGGARFGGHAWVKNRNGSNSVAVVEGVGYGYRQNVSVNNTLVARSHVRGAVGIYQASQTNATSNGSSVNAFQAGKVHHYARTWLPGQNKSKNRSRQSRYVELVDDSDSFGTEESSVEYFDSDENGEFFQAGRPLNRPYHGNQRHHRRNHSNNTIKSFFEAGWKAGTHTTTSLASNITSLVNSTNAAVYRARGWDSYHRKRWNVTGNKTISTSFTNALGSNQLDNIIVSLNDKPAFVQKLANLPDPKLPNQKLPKRKLPNRKLPNRKH